jgi:hypothetical protein
MKIKLRFAGLLLVLVITVVLIASVPGSEGDPLITRGFLEQEMAKMRAELRAELMAEIGGTQFTVAEVRRGSVIIGEAGTKMILRGGEAMAFSLAPNGLADLTAGVEVMHGSPVSLNHYLLISRDDVRGVQIMSDVAWLIIEGKHEIIILGGTG